MNQGGELMRWKPWLARLAVMTAVVGGAMFVVSTSQAVGGQFKCRSGGWICYEYCGLVICTVKCYTDPDFMGPPVSEDSMCAAEGDARR